MNSPFLFRGDSEGLNLLPDNILVILELVPALQRLCEGGPLRMRCYNSSLGGGNGVLGVGNEVSEGTDSGTTAPGSMRDLAAASVHE